MHFVSLVLTLITFWFDVAPPAKYTTLRAEAETRYAEKSFARAHELYETAAKLELPAAERRWVELRLADTTWRADAANPANDGTARDAARDALIELIRKSGDDHDRIWAEAEESLGDYFGTHPRAMQRGMERQYYEAALDWWAGSDDLTLARRRYLDIVWRLARNPWNGEDNPQQLGRDILSNAVAIAETPDDRARSRYLLATLLLNYGAGPADQGFKLLDEVIAAGRSTAWYDDALFLAAQQLESRGEPVVLEDGRPGFRPNYRKALSLYRRIVDELKPGETKYFSQAEMAIRKITGIDIDVFTAGTFLPRSEQEVTFVARNTKKLDVTITSVDLARDLDATSNSYRTLASSVRSDRGRIVRTLTIDMHDAGDYAPQRETQRLSPPLEPGAYVINARTGSSSNSTVLLVTDAAIVAHSTPRRLEVYFADVLSGAPIAGAQVFLWEHSNDREVSRVAQTDANGLASFDTPGSANGRTLITASAGARQAYHELNVYRGDDDSREGYWKVYTFTDRPAFRPGETVQWKIIAREHRDEQWLTPAKKKLAYEITGPRGEKVASGEAQLNEYGTFAGELPLTSAMALGAYQITFRTIGEKTEQGDSAQLFRLEEYKLPEFRVDVTTPSKKLYRLGDTIEATIDASYYFGGALANATVEVVVHEETLFRGWYPYRDYPWYYDNDASERYGYGGGAIVKRETLRTDANGRAILRLETTSDGRERRFRIEARVTDASRREVTGSGSVAVAKQRYSVYAYPRHYIHRAGEPVSIEFKALDANEQPVQTTGTVKVTRRAWLRDEKRYGDEEIATSKVTTDAKGDASFTFTATRDGYYAVQWTSEDRLAGEPLRAGDVVTADTTVFVARESSTDLGYWLAGGIQLIVDKETVKPGETAQVLIVTPSSGRWVLLSTAGDRLFDTRVIHLDGTAKVVPLTIDDRHTPNFFVTATSLYERTLSTDMKSIVVPPLAHFIDVDVKADRAEYEPRQQGNVTITTRDATGKPVSAEVAVSVSDESVTAIASDPAGDPREAFFGAMRDPIVQVSSGVQSQRYVRYVKGKDDQLVDDRQIRDEKKEGDEEDERGVEGGVVGGVAGGVVGGMLAAPAPPFADMAAQKSSVAEAITVTAQAPMLRKDGAAANAAAPAGMEVVVRSDFRSTAFWKPDVITNSDGVAHVTLAYPEALTTWRTTARAATTGSAFGMGTATSRTSMPLLVRLEAPRFFVEGDRVTVSAVINNNTDAPMRVTPSIEAEGLALQGSATHTVVDVPPHGDARAEWQVVAEHAGNAKLRVRAANGERGDAMEKPFTVYAHGIDKLIARSGKVRGDEALINLELPHERRDTTLSVQLAPSLAVTMLDALPYLLEYPYGCVEQTMSRFLPAAIVARTLAKNGLEPRDIEGKLFGGIEQDSAMKTHTNAKRSLVRIDAVTLASMTRLYDFQHNNGAWGWWKTSDDDAWMTAYVIWGFSIARDGGLDVRRDAVDRAAAWLDRALVQHEDQWENEAWMLHALASWRRAAPNAMERKAFDDVWSHRERLGAYSRALLAIAAHHFGDAERAKVLIRNLEDGVKTDKSPDESRVAVTGNHSTAETIGTAHWGADRFWWQWYEGPVETTSFALQALVLIEPKHRLIEPAMNWLVKNRRGAQWNNTRDTAIALIALNDYLGASGELGGDVQYELTVNGRVIATKKIAAADVLRAPSRFVVDADLVRDANEIRIHRSGSGALYFSAEARFFSLEEPVKAAGNELFVRREYVRLAPKPTLLKGVVYEKIPLLDGDTIDSGDRVEVIVTIETKNNYEYLLFEDLKPAGFEAVALQSGGPLQAFELRDAAVTKSPASSPTRVRRTVAADRTDRSVGVYQELRDRNVALFIDRLPQGTWQIRYPLRAETPGTFHALPLLGQAMYVPEIRANGEELRVTVK
ncbi:MAG: alpha-2-macroglobulin [Acidobacteriota bacterium]|nr:alpha-2-macroglobulin [Acidobacteriota bacterium]